MKDEIGFILRNAARYLARDPKESDILSIFAGQRPLVRPPGKDGGATKAISRNHEVLVSDSGLVTIVGGKWTTYRKMAEDTLDKAAVLAGLEDRPCVTEKLQLLGWRSPNAEVRADWLAVYGSEAEDILGLIAQDSTLGDWIHPKLPYPAATVLWATRHEQARTLEDVLSRRTRALLLDAQAAIESAPGVAALLAKELGHDDAWAKSQVEEFTALAKGYLAGSIQDS
jgi:glycerol-3-phosphate dehydrogenase